MVRLMLALKVSGVFKPVGRSRHDGWFLGHFVLILNMLNGLMVN